MTTSMQRSGYLKIASIVAAIAMSITLIPSPSSASEMETERSVTVSNDGITSTLEIEFDEPLTKIQADRKMKEYTSEGIVSSQKAKGPYSLYCNSPTTVTDYNGVFSAQWKCGGKSVPWGYRLSVNLKNHISSSVQETGMRSRVNNGKLKRAHGHHVSKHYQFHGTWYAKKGNTINYYDFFHFNLGKAKGKLTIKGALKLR